MVAITGSHCGMASVSSTKRDNARIVCRFGHFCYTRLCTDLQPLNYYPKAWLPLSSPTFKSLIRNITPYTQLDPTKTMHALASVPTGLAASAFSGYYSRQCRGEWLYIHPKHINSECGRHGGVPLLYQLSYGSTGRFRHTLCTGFSLSHRVRFWSNN